MKKNDLGDFIMKFTLNQDYHIHTKLSSCSADPKQTPERILQYAKQNGFTEVCITDHFWDETVPGASPWYQPQNFAHISKSLPLPQSKDCRMYFGCETDMDKHFTLGISRETMDKLDFIIVPTTHMHMTGVTVSKEDSTISGLTRLYVERIHALLNMDLPFYKMGWAHPTCPLLANHTFEDHITVIQNISDDAFKEIFSSIAKKGMGVELNMPVFEYSEEQFEKILRPYRIAKQCGCKFYFGSDAHHPDSLDAAKAGFEKIAAELELEETDRFAPFRK